MAGDSQTLAGPKEIFLERHFSTSLKGTPDNLYELACRYVLDCVSASECVCVCVCVWKDVWKTCLCVYHLRVVCLSICVCVCVCKCSHTNGTQRFWFHPALVTAMSLFYPASSVPQRLHMSPSTSEGTPHMTSPRDTCRPSLLFPNCYL